MDRSLLLDKGGRRSGIDRRRYSYTVHIPERRYSKDRRQNLDRRGKQAGYGTLGKKKDPGQDIAVY
jgi:hypothetical protein